MNYNNLLTNRIFSPELAKAYGFSEKQESPTACWEFTAPLPQEDFYAVFGVTFDDGSLPSLDARVFEKVDLADADINAGTAVGKQTSLSASDNQTAAGPAFEEYTLFSAEVAVGSFTASIRESALAIAEDIARTCFAPATIKETLLEYVLSRYGTVPEAPWEDEPDYHTLKTARRQKWYGIFMRIPYSRLGLDASGETDIMNIKLPPEKVQQLTDGVHFFPAYHMNKKYWLSVLLAGDSHAPLEDIEALIDESYSLVEK